MGALGQFRRLVGPVLAVLTLLAVFAAGSGSARAADWAIRQACIDSWTGSVSGTFVTADGISIQFAGYGDAATYCYVLSATSPDGSGTMTADEFISYYQFEATLEAGLLTITDNSRDVPCIDPNDGSVIIGSVCSTIYHVTITCSNGGVVYLSGDGVFPPPPPPPPPTPVPVGPPPPTPVPTPTPLGATPTPTPRPTVTPAPPTPTPPPAFVGAVPQVAGTIAMLPEPITRVRPDGTDFWLSGVGTTSQNAETLYFPPLSLGGPKATGWPVCDGWYVYNCDFTEPVIRTITLTPVLSPVQWAFGDGQTAMSYGLYAPRHFYVATSRYGATTLNGLPADLVTATLEWSMQVSYSYNYHWNTHYWTCTEWGLTTVMVQDTYYLDPPGIVIFLDTYHPVTSWGCLSYGWAIGSVDGPYGQGPVRADPSLYGLPRLPDGNVPMSISRGAIVVQTDIVDLR